MCNLHSSLLLLAKIFPVSYEPSMKAERDMSMNICLFHNLPEKCKAILRVKLSVVFVKERPFWSSTVFPLWKTKTLEAKAKHLLAYVPWPCILVLLTISFLTECGKTVTQTTVEEAVRKGPAGMDLPAVIQLIIQARAAAPSIQGTAHPNCTLPFRLLNSQVLIFSCIYSLAEGYYRLSNNENVWMASNAS